MSSFDARFFDGQSARAIETKVHLRGERLVVEDGDNWQTSDIRAQSDSFEALVLENAQTHARLVFLSPLAVDHFRTHVPDAFSRRASGRDWRRLILWGGGSIVGVLAIFFVILPYMSSQLALLMPRDREIELGEALVDQMIQNSEFIFDEDAGRCTDGAGHEALDALVAALVNDRELEYVPNIHAIDSSMVNAFALPGGQILIMRGLIDDADSPEEIVAVIAHEIGHVEARDPLRGLFASLGRSAILSLIIGDATGGIILTTGAQALIDGAYSQSAETNADEFGVAMLNDAGIGGEPLAGFFDKLAAEFGDVEGFAAHFSSHPQLSLRAQAARDASKVSETVKLLSDQQWEDLRGICRSVAERENGRVQNWLESTFGN